MELWDNKAEEPIYITKNGYGYYEYKNYEQIIQQISMCRDLEISEQQIGEGITTKAARHLLDGIEKLYDRLEDNPFQFTDCRDSFLRSKGFKEALRGFSAAALLQMKGLFESLSVLKTYPLHMTWEALNGPAPAPPVI